MPQIGCRHAQSCLCFGPRRRFIASRVRRRRIVETRPPSSPWRLAAAAIKRLRIKGFVRVAELQCERPSDPDRHRAVEARTPPGVAGPGARLDDPDPHGILIAIDPHLDDALGMTGLLAFAPQPLAP